MVLAQELDWLPHIGDSGVAVAIVIMLVIALGVLGMGLNAWRVVAMARIDMEREDRRERRQQDAHQARERMEIERDRVKAEDRQAAIMERLKLTLDGTQTALGRLLEIVATNPTRADIQEAGQTMRAWAAEHDSRLNLAIEHVKAVPDEVWRRGDEHIAALRGDIAAVPERVWQHSDPTLEPLIAGLREILREGFQTIEDGIAARLDAMGEMITPGLRGMIQQELAQYERQSQRPLQNVALLLEALREDLDARRECDDTRAGVANATAEPDGDDASEAPQAVAGAQQPKTDSTEEKKEGTS